jgi:RNA polymerase sigma-70 factor (ECF subfamily)
MTESQYNQCVNNYSDHLFRFIVKNLQHEEDSRDIVQTAFEKLWRNRETVENDKAKSFLFTVGYNQMIDHIRKHKKVELKDDFSDDNRTQYIQDDGVKKTLMQALNRLNQTQKSL